MMDHASILLPLIAKFPLGDLNRQEQITLCNWIAENKENAILFFKMTNEAEFESGFRKQQSYESPHLWDKINAALEQHEAAQKKDDDQNN